MSRALRMYHRRKNARRCVACGRKRPVGGTRRCAACRTKRAEISARQKANRPKGNCRSCLRRKARKDRATCIRCAKRHRAKAKRQYLELRLAVFKLYGGRCVCCGNANPKYLQLDHKNNNGARERKRLPPHLRGGHFYKYVLNKPRRRGLQLLCGNCHQAKRHGGCTEDDHVFWRSLSG